MKAYPHFSGLDARSMDEEVMRIFGLLMLDAWAVAWKHGWPLCWPRRKDITDMTMWRCSAISIDHQSLA